MFFSRVLLWGIWSHILSTFWYSTTSVNIISLKIIYIITLIFSLFFPFTGLEGLAGVRGGPGLAGIPGLPGKPAPSRGYYFTRHSQTTNVPECPFNAPPMWSGYSLLYLQGNKRAHGQDLG